MSVRYRTQRRLPKGLRVTVAIDDFGTGYCSLSYVAKLPVNSLKIDRTFIVGMTESSDGLAIVSSMIALAHSLKLKVVAEGVETEQQEQQLRLLACDEADCLRAAEELAAV
jgi:EAL domain-containing protein (putative c-di-GMP-specific phosphodiesterase class I)